MLNRAFFRIFATHNKHNSIETNQKHRFITMGKSKKRIDLEFELNTSSASKIWTFISDASGLERWMADKVERHGKKLTFTWGTTYKDKDEKTASITDENKEKFIRFKWDGDEDPNAYCEMRIETGEITNNCILCITDFAEEDDIENLKELWDDNIEMLHQTSGL